MANNTLKARLRHASKTEADWKSSNPVLLKGEVAYSSDKKQTKTGDGTSKWLDLEYDKAIPTSHDHDLSTMINALGTGTATPSDNDYYVSQWAGGGTDNTTFIRRPVSSLWNYIKSKLHKVATSGSYNDLSNRPSTGTASTSGLTKLYTGTGTATDGTMTQAAIKSGLDSKAASNHTHNYAGSSSAGGAANTAVKLQTARTVSSAGDFDMKFSYDGSANSSATLNYYNTSSGCGNKNNYPFHRFAKLDVITDSYVDKASTFLITQDYQNAGWGIVQIALRTNNVSSSDVAQAEITWLVRKKLSADSVQIGLYNVAGKTYADAFFKHAGTYTSTTIRNIASGARGSISRTWTLVSSNEVNNTTTSDKLKSVEVYTTIASAATTLHNQAYTNIISGVDSATVSYANSSGSASSATKLSTARKINGVAFDGTKDIDNVIYKTKAEYDALVKAGKLDKNAMYVTTDETDGVSEAATKMWNLSSSLAKQGKYLSYSDQDGGKYLSLMNASDNTAVAHAKLMDGESGEGMDVDADKVKTVDSKGILVEALGETTAQALVDEVAKRVLDLTSRMSSAENSITSLNSNYAKKEIPSTPCSWANGIPLAYFKMSKNSGDVFNPFIKMPTDNGAWVLGTHSKSDKLLLRYYSGETGIGTAYWFSPNTEKNL